MRPGYFKILRQSFYSLALSFTVLISSLGALPTAALAAPNQPQFMALFGSIAVAILIKTAVYYPMMLPALVMS